MYDFESGCPHSDSTVAATAVTRFEAANILEFASTHDARQHDSENRLILPLMYDHYTGVHKSLFSRPYLVLHNRNLSPRRYFIRLSSYATPVFNLPRTHDADLFSYFSVSTLSPIRPLPTFSPA